ncbi:MAG: GNAT family N-acetyltransferase [Pseudomonadota bacterium]
MFEFKLIDSIHAIDATDWNHVLLSNDSTASELADCFPFLRHEFLSALEDSGSVCVETGWTPQHVLIYKADDATLCGVMPMYLKEHSYGEFVFDQSWAEAYESYGMSYYPKLVTAIPFSPVEGPRLALTQTSSRTDVLNELMPFLNAHMDSETLLSWHVLFVTSDDAEMLLEHGCVQRISVNFHWFNNDFDSMDDFMAKLASRKRKNLKKERALVESQGVTLQRIDGVDVNESQWRFFFECYQRTYLRKSGHFGYLNQRFFQLLAQSMPEQLMLVLALDSSGKMVASALNFKDSQVLYGRYWGCSEDFNHLHFETCYYQGIEYCIEHELSKFDPGVQGEHKLKRGFEPVYTYSSVLLKETVLSQPIDNFLAQERDYLSEYKKEMAQQLPFRKVDMS